MRIQLRPLPGPVDIADEGICAARRQGEDAHQVIEVVGRHQFSADKAPTSLLEIEDGPRSKSETIAKLLRDRDPSLLADRGLHSAIV